MIVPEDVNKTQNAMNNVVHHSHLVTLFNSHDQLQCVPQFKYILIINKKFLYSQQSNGMCLIKQAKMIQIPSVASVISTLWNAS